MRLAAVALLMSVSATSLAFAQDYVFPETERRNVERNPLEFQRSLIIQLFQLTPDGVLTEERAAFAIDRRKAQLRVHALREVPMYDLDGNGSVSAGEVQRLRDGLFGRELGQLEQFVIGADANRDGAVSSEEIKSYGDALIAEQRGRPGQEITRLMQFDYDGDGSVTVDDIINAVGSITASVQMDQEQAMSPAVMLSRCDWPKPSDEAQVIVLGAYEGTAVSTVAVAGQDRETSFATLEIEDGETPLYIVTAVYDPMVFRLTGATDRVERFVGVNRSGIGVAGLDAERVTLSGNAGACGLAYFTKPPESTQFETLGFEVDLALGTYNLGRVGLPSGRGLTTRQLRNKTLTIIQGNRRFELSEDGVKEVEGVEPKAPAKGVEAMMLRFYPDGIESVMPEDVVAVGKVEAYEVLPQQAGLLQLVQSGQLSLLPDGTFSIDKPIARFPAGLNGGHSVKFLLRRGVPMPKGSPGHSSVKSEATGECLTHHCR